MQNCFITNNTSCKAGVRHDMPPPLQADNIFVFIHQVAHVPVCLLIKTSATIGTEVAHVTRTWLGHHSQGQKVKGQCHQAALLTAAFTHQAAAAVTVGTYPPWEPTTTLRSGAVVSAARGTSAPTEGREGRGHIVAAPAQLVIILVNPGADCKIEGKHCLLDYANFSAYGVAPLPPPPLTIHQALCPWTLLGHFCLSEPLQASKKPKKSN